MLRRGNILNILHSSLVGLRVEVVGHSDPSIVGLSGSIVKETRHMLHIDSQGMIKKIAKQPGKFRIYVNSSSFIIEGRLLEGDAKRRSKRKLRHW